MTPGTTYDHLGTYSDWVDEAQRHTRLRPAAAPGPETQHAIRRLFDFGSVTNINDSVRVERTWKRDGLRGEELSWSVGYGPRTGAWLIRPDTDDALPGVVALHCHGMYKFYGKEKIADGPDGQVEGVADYRRSSGGRAYVNALARQGFAVLVHDVFMWGSRRFEVDAMPAPARHHMNAYASTRSNAGEDPSEMETYNVGATDHEHTVAKYCSILGTSVAGVVNHEDRLAVEYLASRPDVIGDRVACMGFSGGGARAAMLQATSPLIRASVIVGMMSTHAELLNRHVAPHTWMIFPAGLPRVADWPDLASCRAPSPLFVQYGADDEMFSPSGMHAAHERIAANYASVDAADAYTGTFYDTGHSFTRDMQDDAFRWLTHQIAR